nr:hypothetical protein [Tanacetum cinerariifolium]
MSVTFIISFDSSYSNIWNLNQMLANVVAGTSGKSLQGNNDHRRMLPLGKCHKEEWRRGLKALRADTLAKLKKEIPKLKHEFDVMRFPIIPSPNEDARYAGVILHTHNAEFSSLHLGTIATTGVAPPSLNTEITANNDDAA